MARTKDILDQVMKAAVRYRGLLLPIMAMAMVLVVLAPLPAWLMDILLAANIALAGIILITTVHMASPLEFSVFPSLLLGTTLMRLVLNIATTRLILTAGADHRTADQAQYAAGQVVWAFGHFIMVGADNALAVGVVLFVILAIIQFVVITKGTARISEVAARFVLDAMPGKQMAIDADLNAGLIDQQQARTRRDAITQEADFYGAMDGAGKFLRGDAIAAVIITAVNIIGGLYIGRTHYGWEWSATVDVFTRLTVGEALVMQVPAFLISISAALMVTRGASKRNLGEESIRQLSAHPVALGVTAVFLGLLAFTPLPTVPLLVLAGCCGGLAWIIQRGIKQSKTAQEAGQQAKRAPTRAAGEDYEELINVDPMRIDLGFALIRMADDTQGGDLLERVSTLRRTIAGDLGLLTPPIRIRDDLRLDSHHYVIRIRGQKVAGGRLYASSLLAMIGDGVASGKLTGRPGTDPVTHMPALWISPQQRDVAGQMNYAVLSAADVLVRHLEEIIRTSAPQLLTRQQVTRMLDALKTRAEGLVTETLARVPVAQVQKVLQNLLAERVSIRDLESVLEALGEAATRTTDSGELTEQVRMSLSRSISRQYCTEDGKLYCVSLDGQVEDVLAARAVSSASGAIIEPEMASRLGQAAGAALSQLRREGRKPVLICAPQVRTTLRKLVAPAMPEAAVLAYTELDTVEVYTTATVGIEL